MIHSTISKKPLESPLSKTLSKPRQSFDTGGRPLRRGIDQPRRGGLGTLSAETPKSPFRNDEQVLDEFILQINTFSLALLSIQPFLSASFSPRLYTLSLPFITNELS